MLPLGPFALCIHLIFTHFPKSAGPGRTLFIPPGPLDVKIRHWF